MQRRIQTGDAAVEIMNVGSFTRSRARERVVGDAQSAILFEPDTEYRISHTTNVANCGLTIRISPHAFHRLAAPPGRRKHPAWERGEVRLSPAATLLHSRLMHATSNAQKTDPFTVESLVTALVGTLLSETATAVTEPDSLVRARAAAIREHVSTCPDRPTLSSLAELTGCSIWTVSRDFRRCFGIGLCAYISRVQLWRALSLLVAGRDGLTSVALECGFSSHSHFTARFRREFGLTPSAFLQATINATSVAAPRSRARILP